MARDKGIPAALQFCVLSLVLYEMKFTEVETLTFVQPVSYTHLDVYKRQLVYSSLIQRQMDNS